MEHDLLQVQQCHLRVFQHGLLISLKEQTADTLCISFILFERSCLISSASVPAQTQTTTLTLPLSSSSSSATSKHISNIHQASSLLYLYLYCLLSYALFIKPPRRTITAFLEMFVFFSREHGVAEECKPISASDPEFVASQRSSLSF